MTLAVSDSFCPGTAIERTPSRREQGAPGTAADREPVPWLSYLSRDMSAYSATGPCVLDGSDTTREDTERGELVTQFGAREMFRGHALDGYQSALRRHHAIHTVVIDDVFHHVGRLERRRHHKDPSARANEPQRAAKHAQPPAAFRMNRRVHTDGHVKRPSQ